MTIAEQALQVRRYRLNTPLSSRCQAPAASSPHAADTASGPLNMQDRLGRTPNQCRPARREHAGRPPPSPYCWYGITASPMRTGLFCGPPPVTSSRST